LPDQKLVVRIAPQIDALPELLDQVEAFTEAMRVSSQVAYRLAVVCEELVANIAMHGAHGAAAATFVEVEIYRDADCLHLSVEDDGRPFDPLTQPPPDTTLALDDRKIGGLGIHFARHMVLDISYERSSGRNHVAAVFDTKEIVPSAIDSD
jgi:serine/threonine-protein kinase RsbW